MAKNPTGKQIAGILVSVGLAQNFAAIRALAIEGIQKGHMNLHAKNIAVSAGVPPNLIKEVVTFMKSKGSITIETAQDYMKAHQIYISTSKNKKGQIKEQQNFSTCFIKIENPMITEKIILNLIIDTPPGETPIHLTLTNDEKDSEIVKTVLGHHSYDWVLKFLLMLTQFYPMILLPDVDKAKNISIRYRLKLIVILINHVVTTILTNYEAKGVEIIEGVYSVCHGDPIQYEIPSSMFYLHNLLVELIATYKHYIDANIENKFLKEVRLLFN